MTTPVVSSGTESVIATAGAIDQVTVLSAVVPSDQMKPDSRESVTVYWPGSVAVASPATE